MGVEKLRSLERAIPSYHKVGVHAFASASASASVYVRVLRSALAWPLCNMDVHKSMNSAVVRAPIGES